MSQAQTMTERTKTARELGWMREACRVVAQTLDLLRDAAQPGVSTEELDKLAKAEIIKRGAKPAFLGYRGYPKTLCVSINEEVVHGIPSASRKLKAGDIVGLDLGAIVKGFYGDSAVTVAVGEVSAPARALIEATRESLMRGIGAAGPGKRIGDISHAVQSYAEGKGFSVVREFVGHGIGRALHEDPAVPNYGRAGFGPRLVAGMTIAIEPMLNAGGPEVAVLADGWTAVTRDRSLSAHYEHTIAITEDGCEILTLAA